MKCAFCGAEKSSMSGTNFGNICNLCNWLLCGKPMNDSADFDYQTPDGITLWIKDGKVETAWTECGMTSVPIDAIQQYVPMLEPMLVIDFIRHLLRRNEILCSQCGKLLSNKEIAGSHFAGVYCKECWESYKKDNSRKCLRCGDPMWKCCC